MKKNINNNIKLIQKYLTNNKNILFILTCILFIILISLQLIFKFKFQQHKFIETFTTYDNFEYSDNLTINEIKILKIGQQKMTNMLKFFIDICNKYDIKYWAIGGTLIGAIRHSGWIPWDGDLDIGMMREDFNKFKSVIDNELNNNKFNKKYIFEKKYDFLYKLRDPSIVYLKTEWGANWDNDLGLQLDIFINEIDKNKKHITGIGPVVGTPGALTVDYDKIFPLKKLKFEGMDISVPNDYENLSKETWGDNPPKLLPKEKRFPHEGRMKIIS